MPVRKIFKLGTGFILSFFCATHHKGEEYALIYSV